MLWRGGRRPKDHTTKQTQPQANGISKKQDVEVITIDDSDEEQPRPSQPDDEDHYEAEEEEQDPDCPYPPTIQDLDMDLGVDVLHMAIPSGISLASSQPPRLAKTHVIAALGYADGRIVLMIIPLAPPTSAAKHEFLENEVIDLQLETDGKIPRDLAIKVVPKDEQSMEVDQPTNGAAVSEGRILVAAVASSFNIWSLSLTAEFISQSPTSLQPMVHAPVSGSRVSFQSSPRLNQLLLGDRSGAVRIYDLSAAKVFDQRPSSRDSAPPAASEALGRWLMSYHTPFHLPKGGAALVRCKQILDAVWVLGGRAILVLLEDGEWGIRDPSGSTQPQSGKNVEDFVLRGYLGTSSATSEVVDAGKQKRAGSKLAPMTPNTRKAKAENLFSGTPKPPGVAANGGVSISTTNTRAGHVDESVIMWYNNDIYSIPSMQSFWQRSTSGGGGFGSLYAPGLTHISDINLINENITSISQFASNKSSTSSLGQMNLQRDLMVSAEYRFVILQSLRPPVVAKEVLQQAAERPTSRDQRMLDAGDLDLGGMDRMLDSMAGEGRTRRVGFAH